MSGDNTHYFSIDILGGLCWSEDHHFGLPTWNMLWPLDHQGLVSSLDLSVLYAMATTQIIFQHITPLFAFPLIVWPVSQHRHQMLLLFKLLLVFAKTQTKGIHFCLFMHTCSTWLPLSVLHLSSYIICGSSLISIMLISCWKNTIPIGPKDWFFGTDAMPLSPLQFSAARHYDSTEPCDN